MIGADGVLLKKGALFSEGLSVRQKIPKTKINAFFNEFRDFLVGRADVSEKIKKCLNYLDWNGSVEWLLSFWHGEIEPGASLFKWALSAGKRSVLVFLAKNNDKRRAESLSKSLGLKEVRWSPLVCISLGNEAGKGFLQESPRRSRGDSPGYFEEPNTPC